MLSLDAFRLLGYGESLDTHKSYTMTIGPLRYHGPDRQIVVIHKKSLKLINLKNLGDGMEVIVAYDTIDSIPKTSSIDLIESALMFNPSYDEETGELRYFLPSASHKLLSQYQAGYARYDSRSDVFVVGQDHSVRFAPAQTRRSYPSLEIIGDWVSFWSGLKIVYGQTQSSGDTISSIRRQIPLVGDVQTKLQYLQDSLDHLLQQGYIISSQLLESGKYPVLQVVTHDYELIESLEISPQIRMKEEVSHRKRALKETIHDQNLVDTPSIYDLRRKLIRK